PHMTRARCALAPALAIGLAGPAAAQSYPDRPLRLLAPFPAGGPTDTTARIVAQGLSSRLGQPVVVENQAGAGGTIGARQAATAPPDGYTLLLISGANMFGTVPILYKIRFDPMLALSPGATWRA